ncbi:MAG: Trm112 family protein [Candidatus Nitrosocosmicus sp.]|nr:Trm112 family protein [Candidatus Nitrosocosmicus sp.]
MNKKLLDILVCPFDKVSSLELFQFKTKTNPSNPSTISNNNASESKDSLTTQKENDQEMKDIDMDKKSPSVSEMDIESIEIVEEGLLLCRTCLRFYPITEEIPIILPDELRDKKKDMEFLKTWNDSIPNDLLKNLKPWTI